MSLTFPGFDKLWLLQNPLATRPFRGEVLEVLSGESIVGRGYPSELRLQPFVKAIGKPTESLIIRWSRGSITPSKIIWIDHSVMVVSPTVLETLSAFSGWSTYPVTVEHHETAGYAGFSVSGRSGPAAMDTSNIISVGDHLEYEGILFDPKSWDGSDIFWPSNGWGPLVTDRARRSLTNDKIYNIELTRCDKIRFAKMLYDKHVTISASRRASGRYSDDPMRPYMIRLGCAGSVRHAVTSDSVMQCEIPAELDQRLLGPGIRIVVFDEVEEVDAIVRSIDESRWVEAIPIARGYGSLRLRPE